MDASANAFLAGAAGQDVKATSGRDFFTLSLLEWFLLVKFLTRV